MNPARALLLVFSITVLGACASKVLDYDKDKAELALRNDEYEKSIQVKSAPVEPPPAVDVKPAGTEKEKKTNTKTKKKETSKAASVKKPGPHEPDIEDSEGFIGRRPVVDPFR